MKNLQIILFTMAMIMSVNSNGQMIVDQQGQIGIGAYYNNHNDVPHTWKLDVDGNAQFKLAMNSKLKMWGFYAHPYITPAVNNKGFLGANLYGVWSKWYGAYITNIHYDNLYDFSDESIKENIKPLGSSLDKILAINTISYDLKADYYKDSDPDDMEKLIKEGKNQVGVIAQELQKVLPNLVKYEEDSKLFAVNYIDLIPYLIKATQEQQAIIEELKEEIKNLKDRK